MGTIPVVKPLLSGKIAWALVGVAIAYTALHFAFSGVRFPLQNTNFGQVQVNFAPLQEHLSTGLPIRSANGRMYGPVFFFALHPLLTITRDRVTLDHWLYAGQLVSIFVALLCCVLSLRLWLAGQNERGVDRRIGTPDLAVLLGLLWLNFSPLYSILAGKNVEMWELCLISVALYFYLRRWRFGAAFCIAAAALIKMLPIVFLLYFLIRDRRTLGYAIVSFAILLTASQLLYGTQMGYGSLPFMLSAAVGQTHALGWHENIGAKNMVIKVLTGWKLTPPYYFAPIGGQQLLIASVLGHAIQVAGVLWVAWALMTFQSRSRDAASFDALWGWSLISVMLLILSPVTAFEYMVLSLIAFSFSLAFLVSRNRLQADRSMWLLFAGATLLVANIVPRQVINVVFPIAALNRLTGNDGFLTLSEGYQHYGFPFLGQLMLLAVLWMQRPVVSGESLYATTLADGAGRTHEARA